LYAYLVFVLLGGGYLAAYTRAESFFMVNGLHAPWADVFFNYLTYAGDGAFFLGVLLVLLLYRYRLALIGLAIFLTTSLVVQLLKHLFFSHVLRPVGYFGADNPQIHFVEGVVRHAQNSFPSGHTATAFALALFVVMAFNIHKQGWLLAVLAMLVGYSRVYLAVHFPVDVYVGSIIGVVIAWVGYTRLNDVVRGKFGDRGLLNRG